MASGEEHQPPVSPADVTIRDVAKAAGVSVATVSRILNDKPDVADRTKLRVLQVIDELGYMPHSQARSLAKGRTKTVALLFPLETEVRVGFSQVELDFIIGAAAAVGEANYFLNLVTTQVTEQALLALYRTVQVDGVILMEGSLQDWRVDLLRQYDYPFVMIGQCADNTDLILVELDFKHAVIEAFEYLIGLGHKHIGFLGLPQLLLEQNHGTAVRALEGYQTILDRHGIASPYKPIDFSADAALQATLSLLDEDPNMTALVTAHGGAASGIIRALYQQNLDIPGDFSVIAIATQRMVEATIPALTVIDFPTYDMGFTASKLLINKLRKRPIDSEQVFVEPKVIVRETTGPPLRVIDRSR